VHNSFAIRRFAAGSRRILKLDQNLKIAKNRPPPALSWRSAKADLGVRRQIFPQNTRLATATKREPAKLFFSSRRNRRSGRLSGPDLAGRGPIRTSEPFSYVAGIRPTCESDRVSQACRFATLDEPAATRLFVKRAATRLRRLGGWEVGRLGGRKPLPCRRPGGVCKKKQRAICSIGVFLCGRATRPLEWSDQSDMDALWEEAVSIEALGRANRGWPISASIEEERRSFRGRWNSAEPGPDFGDSQITIELVASAGVLAFRPTRKNPAGFEATRGFVASSMRFPRSGFSAEHIDRGALPLCCFRASGEGLVGIEGIVPAGIWRFWRLRSPAPPPGLFPANAKPRRRGYRAAGFWDYVTSYRDSKFGFSVLCRPGSDLLSRVLRQSTIGAEEFNGRVRNGIGFRLLAMTTRPAKHRNWFWFVTDVHSLEGG
jgi:hypothetical protein